MRFCYGSKLSFVAYFQPRKSGTQLFSHVQKKALGPINFNFNPFGHSTHKTCCWKSWKWRENNKKRGHFVRYFCSVKFETHTGWWIRERLQLTTQKATLNRGANKSSCKASAALYSSSSTTTSEIPMFNDFTQELSFRLYHWLRWGVTREVRFFWGKIKWSKITLYVVINISMLYKNNIYVNRTPTKNDPMVIYVGIAVYK